MMTLGDYEVPQAVLDACLDAMVDGFQVGEIQAVAEAHGVPAGGGIAKRIVDQLIQQQKEAGLIAFDGRRWRRIAQSASIRCLDARDAMFSVMQDEGWSVDAALEVALQYIDNQDSHAAFLDFLDERRAVDTCDIDEGGESHEVAL